MEYAALGKSGLQISRIGFGCMSLGNDNEANIHLLRKALAMGVNYFDTADLYANGLNEETVGIAFDGMRDKIVLATKVGNQVRADGSGWDWNPSRNYIVTAVEKSLKRLRTDYIDLYQLHGGTIHDPIDETIDAFEILKRQGKIRHYGISSIRPNVIREYVKRSGIVSVMMQYSLLDRRPEETIFELLRENNISLLTRGTLAGGLLVNKAAKPYLDYDIQQVSKMQEVVASVSTERSKTDTAIQFNLQQSAVTSAVIGIRTAIQLDESLHALQAPRLNDSEVAKLTQSLPVNSYHDHR